MLCATTLSLTATAHGDFAQVLQQIEQNSIQLRTLAEQMEAEKLSNHTGISLDDPEVEFSYLWGSPSNVGNRTDFSVSQSFDFPTAYSHRSQIANKKDVSTELRYKSERTAILLQAKQTAIQLTYNNARLAELEQRLSSAKQIATSYERKATNGEANIIERNKAKLSLATIESQVADVRSEREVLRSELQRLNGGVEISLNESYFALLPITKSFDEWYTQAKALNPILSYVEQEVEIAESQIRLARSMNLPKLKVGYMQETVVGTNFRGISLGASIPLWQNKNRVKQTKASLEVTKSQSKDKHIEFQNYLHGLYQKAIALQQTVASLESAMSSYSSSELLKKALTSGEISLLEYLLELQYQYTATDNLLNAQRDLALTKAQLYEVML